MGDTANCQSICSKTEPEQYPVDFLPEAVHMVRCHMGQGQQGRVMPPSCLYNHLYQLGNM